MSITTQTTIDGIYSVNWSATNFAIKYELQEKTDNGAFITIQNTSALSRSFNKTSNHVYRYQVRACNFNECSGYSNSLQVLVDLPINPAAPAVFEVYQDLNTQRRFLTWQGNSNNNGLGITSYKIKAYDSNNNVVFERQVAIDYPQPFVLNSLSPTRYTLSECTSSACGDERQDTLFDQGLSRVTDLGISWTNTSPNNRLFKFNFNYPAALLSGTGTAYGDPTEFKIYSDIGTTSGNNLIATILFSSGNTTIGWQSIDVPLDSNTGNSFKVYACNQHLGCGVASGVTVGAPLTSNNLVIPTGVTVSDNGSASILLSWSVANTQNIDYFEVTEILPAIRANHVYTGISVNNALHDKMFYVDIEDVTDTVGNTGYKLALARQTRGGYRYKIRSCKRDRKFGDVCSAQQEHIWHDITLDRVRDGDITLSGGKVSMPTSLVWYDFVIDSNTNHALSWQFDHTGLNYTPDYFYITKANETGSNNCGMEQFTVNYADKVIVAGHNTWTTEVDCTDLGLETKWQVQACINGVGCSPYSTTIEIGETSQQGNNASSESLLGSQGVIGGPGDFNPGLWWHPELGGTGWHFYWASDLRYDSDDPKYKNTYDLIGYWFAYREINGVWTPTWFEARLKQVIANSEAAGGYFEGDIFYHRKTASSFDKIDTGHIQLNFGNTNQAAELVISPNYTGGLFTATSEAGDISPYTSNGDKLHLQIEDFAVVNVSGPENDADHYTGLWQHFDVNNNPDLSLLTWIERGVEVSTLAMFDGNNIPIWLQMTLTDCNSSVCLPSGSYFDSYDQGSDINNDEDDLTVGIVHNGFNPLATKPLAHDFGGAEGSLVNYHGKFGRCLGSGTDNLRFRDGMFWLNITDHLIYPDADGGSYTRVIPSFGLNSSSCDVGTTEPLTKLASLHDIRYFINDQDEFESQCDPNDITGSGECVITFNWYTDDYFPSIEPYYSLNGGPYNKLNDICPGITQGNEVFVNAGFTCTLAESGIYSFQLRKNKYNAVNETIAIAESRDLQILDCTSDLCNPPVGEPAMAPGPMQFLNDNIPDPENSLVGTTSGVFDIDESGSANYSIPIFAPAGRGGLAPQMALSYSSSSGNGIAGIGWNISGISSITRCLKSIEHDPNDDFFPAIQLNQSDALCLDGQRLFKLADGSYRTEIDSFNEIKAIGVTENGPTKFKIKTKSGEVRVYGSPNAAFKANKIFPSGGTGAQIISNTDQTVHTWLLNKIEDRHGNQMYFVWDTFEGESYLSQVKWTISENESNNHYQIDFEYTDSRPDAMHHYSISTEFKAYRNLDYISTFIRPDPNSSILASDEVRRLKLNYETTPNPSGMLRLASVEQCHDSATCLQPVEFEWDDLDTQIGFNGGNYNSNHIGTLKEMGFGSYKPIDVNGDGAMELIFVRGYDDGGIFLEDLQSIYWIAYHTEIDPLTGEAPPPYIDTLYDPFNPEVLINTCEPVAGGGYYNYICDMRIDPFNAQGIHADEFNAEKWFVLDYNGDGYQDILSPVDTVPGDNNNDNWFVFLSNGEKLCTVINECTPEYQPIDTGIVFYSRDAGSSLLDYTADGLPDLMTFDIDSSSGSDLYKYKLYPMVKDYNGTNFVGYKLSTVGQFIEIDTNKLVPSDMECFYMYEDPITHVREERKSKCISVLTNVDYAGGILAGKLEITASDFNGDGYNDAIYQYRYLYGPEACGLTAPDPSLINEYIYNVTIPLGEYSSEPLIDPNATQGIITERCEQWFKVIMLFNKDPVTSSIEFQYAGRLGVINRPDSPQLQLDDEHDYCEYENLQQCRGDINGKVGASRVIDINGDGLADFSYLSPNNDYKYKLNLGRTISTTVDAVIANDVTIPAYVYDKLVFSEIKAIGLPSITTENKCETANDDSNFHDNDACGRRFLVQYLDYDQDGDVDFMYPALESTTSSAVKYKLKTYQKLANGEFGYQEHVIPSTQQITSYLKSEEPQRYVNTVFDLNGDGHADFFSLLRTENTKTQIVKMGTNPWKTRNKITAITNKVDTKETDILIYYQALTDPTTELSSFYTKSTNSLNTLDLGSPVFDLFAPSYLVSQVNKSSPTLLLPDAVTSVAYSYAGLKVQGGGRGSLGFASINSYDPHHDITTITEYIQEFPYIGMPKSTRSYLGAVIIANRLNESFSIYQKNETDIGLGHTTYFPYLYNSIEKDYALNTEFINGALNYSIETTPQKTILNNFTYSSVDILHGNLSSSVSQTCQGSATNSANCIVVESKTASNDYDDNEIDWILGRLIRTDVTTTRKVGTSYQSKYKASEFDYHPTTGQLIEERIIGDNSNNQFLRTIHVYDDYGQETETYQCSKHLNATSCAIPPVAGRNTIDNTFIHRYSKVVYDNQWDEYIARQIEPFTSFRGFELSTSFTLPYDLDEGTVVEKNTLKVLDFNNQRDIYGNPIYSQDVFGTQVHTYYDDFGQAYATTTNLGTKSVTTRKWCSQTSTFCPNNGSIVVETQTQGSATTRTYSDVLGREIRSQSQMFSFGQWTTVDTFYDQLGRTIKQTEPYVRTDTSTSVGSTFTTTSYDPLDRVLVITSPSHCIENITIDFETQNCIDENVITYTKYEGLSISTTNPNGQVKTQIFDESGKVISSIDPAGKSVNYSYEANGNLSITTSYIDTTGIYVPINMSYDSLGRKIGMIDPDKGTWLYQYNALGELISQQNANLQTTSNYYDIRGRLYYREQPNVNSIWEFDQGANWGQLVNEYSVGEYQSRGLGQIKVNSFDAYHRPSATVTTIHDAQLQPHSYVTSQTYDEFGRLFQSFDATGNGVLYQYNIRGFQETIRDAANDEFGQIYYQVLNTNARGQILHEKYYNQFETTKTYENSTGFLSTIISTNNLNDEIQHLDFAFDSIGNLIRRSDLTPVNNITPDDVWSETFKYDNQNRLLKEFLNYANNPENSYSYDESGNLLTKVNSADGLSTYTYPQNATRPHGVTNVTNTFTGKHNDYTYDNVGNVTFRDGTEDTHFIYTSFDKPETMISTNGWLTEIAYNAGRNRYIRIDASGIEGHTITHYLGSVEYIYKGDLTKAKRYIGNLVINIDNDTSNRSLWKFNYLLKDHIGSTHTIVDQTGDVVTHMSFNAWGARRQPAITGSLILPIYNDYDLFQVWSVMGNTIESTTNRGFTGHEHFDQIGIIHMNGRIYDPSIGRFLQADPIIQDPYDTQSLNRYSYVMNNPLSYTDPTGYSRLRSGWFKQIASIAAMFIPIPGVNILVAAFIRGAVSGAIATGSFKGALKGGLRASLQAAVTYGIGHGFNGGKGIGKPGSITRAVAHGVVGGVSAEIDGGKFGHGFASSVLASGADKLGLKDLNFAPRVITNAVVAGTISELTGGKFANGAMSAAFRVAYNDFGGKWGRFTGGNDSNDSPQPRIHDESSRQALKESIGTVADAGKKVINTLPRPGIAHTVSADVFIAGEGLAVDISAPIFTSCATVSVCDQSGIGLQAGVSVSGDFSIAFGKNFSNTTTFGIFGEVGFIRGLGISADIGFDPVELIIKVDGSVSAGAAAGIQRCTVVTQNTCSN